MTREKKKEKSGNFYLLAKEGGSRRCFVTAYFLPVSLFP